MLSTPLEFLASDVADGLPAGSTSDVWALGYCIFRLRSEEGLVLSVVELTPLEDLVSFGIHTLEDMSRT